MKLSGIVAEVAAKSGKDPFVKGFTVKSSETGNLLKVIAKSPGGRFLMTKLTGKNVGKEVLVEDSERYTLVSDASGKKAGRIAEIKAQLGTLSTQAASIEKQTSELEDELETLEEVG